MAIDITIDGDIAFVLDLYKRLRRDGYHQYLETDQSFQDGIIDNLYKMSKEIMRHDEIVDYLLSIPDNEDVVDSPFIRQHRDFFMPVDARDLNDKLLNNIIRNIVQFLERVKQQNQIIAPKRLPTRSRCKNGKCFKTIRDRTMKVLSRYKENRNVVPFNGMGSYSAFGHASWCALNMYNQFG
jgi:hypothetical protein